jgi:hypothetical protein
MKKLKHLSFEALVEVAASQFEQAADGREAKKVKYPVRDVLMSGVAMMFFQHRSLLQFQRAMEQRRGRSNLQQLFRVEAIPSDTQMREILDGVEPEAVRGVFKPTVERLRRGKQLERLKWIDGKYLVAVDGSQYFSSQTIQCDGCLKKTSRGVTTYSHQILPATLVCPGEPVVIPMDAEEVRNEKGAEVQDCEAEAAKRLLRRLRQEHPRLPMVVTGDGLYSHEPMIELIEELRMDYILVVQPGDHQELFDWVETLQRAGAVESGEWCEDELTHRYRIARDVPLTGSRQRWVNFFEVWVTNRNRRQVYHNSWVTKLKVNRQMIREFVRGGRARWKIENEQFNVQKNQGYEMEHNYGHGQQHLSFNFYLLNLLAFLWHQILELTDRLFQQARRRWGSRRHLWEHLRTVMDLWLVGSWWQMVQMTLSDEPDAPAP